MTTMNERPNGYGGVAISPEGKATILPPARELETVLSFAFERYPASRRILTWELRPEPPHVVATHERMGLPLPWWHQADSATPKEDKPLVFASALLPDAQG